MGWFGDMLKIWSKQNNRFKIDVFISDQNKYTYLIIGSCLWMLKKFNIAHPLLNFVKTKTLSMSYDNTCSSPECGKDRVM